LAKEGFRVQTFSTEAASDRISKKTVKECKLLPRLTNIEQNKK